MLKTVINEILPTLTVHGNHNYIGAGKKSGDGIVTAINKLLPTLQAIDGKHAALGASLDNLEFSSLAATVKKLYPITDLKPTLTARDYKSVGSEEFIESRKNKPGVPQGEHLRREGHNGRLNPEFCEAFMGYPVGWTDLEQSNELITFSNQNHIGSLYPWPVIPKKQNPKRYGNRIKACGNSIVPQAAYQIFKAIEANA